MNPRVTILLVAMMSIAIVALGLRIGAGETVRAAIVVGAPLSHAKGHAAWQVRTQEDDGHTRTAISTYVIAKISARGIDREVDVQTNLDGVAEIPFEIADLALGDRILLEVKSGGKNGEILARGEARWPKEWIAPSSTTDVALRPSRVEGPVKMSVAVLGGALAPGQPGRVWIHSQTNALPSRVDAAPDLGIEIASPYHTAQSDPACAQDGFFELVARGMSGGVELHATDGETHTGLWYGAIPVAAGAMHLDAPVFSPAGPVHISITSGGARSLAYVEVDDDAGRASAMILPLTGEPPHADATLEILTPGKNFIVVSGEPDGAEAMAGATRAFPIWIGDKAPCEMTLAKSAARAFPRFIALDGFVEKRAALGDRRKKGRMLAFIGLALGSLLETLLLLRAARDGKRELENVQNAIIEEGAAPIAPSKRKSLLDALVIIVLSLLGFALLFALIASTSR